GCDLDHDRRADGPHLAALEAALRRGREPGLRRSFPLRSLHRPQP
ncbi:MAG: luciferase-like, partial [uncultured Thermomicrobiales bacterium]